MAQTAQVIEFDKNLKVLDGKKTKDNLPPNNQSATRWVDPIRTKEELDSIEEYLNNRIFCAASPSLKKIQLRNKLLFMLGTRTGFRVSDLERFTWGLIYNKSGKFWVNPQNVKEIKTGKLKPVILTDKMKDIITEYVKLSSVDTNENDYIFVSNKVFYELYNVGSESKIIDDIDISIATTEKEFKNAKHRGLKKEELEKKEKYLKSMNINYSVRRFHISEAGISVVIKDVTEKCNIKGNYACRSLRKTYAWKMYLHGLELGLSEIESLNNVKKFLNHVDINDTMRYLGIKQKKDFEFMNDCIW